MVFFFYIFAFLILVGSFMVVFSNNPINSVFWLIFTLCNSAGIILLTGAEFIAMVSIIVYVGAIAVLFLFVVMMLDLKSTTIKFKIKNIKIIPLFCLLAFLICLVLIVLLSIKNTSVDSTSVFMIDKNKGNIHAIAKFLYTDFFLVFQLCGLILFAAMIASISLTFRPAYSKKQKLLTQLFRTKEDSVKNVSVKSQSPPKNINYEDDI